MMIAIMKIVMMKIIITIMKMVMMRMMKHITESLLWFADIVLCATVALNDNQDHYDDDDDDDIQDHYDDLYIIGAGCLSVGHRSDYSQGREKLSKEKNINCLEHMNKSFQNQFHIK